MPTAERDVALVAAYFDLCALTDHPPFIILPDDHCRLAATMADGADFPQHIGDGKKARAAGEHVALEIRAKPVAHYRDAHIIGDGRQLPDLRVTQELGFIDHHAGKRCAGSLPRHKCFHVGLAIKHEGRGFKADPRSDFSFADPVIKLRGQQQCVHAAFAIIVGCLQQDG